MAHTVLISRFKKMGLVTFMLFLVKGLLWLAVGWIATH